MNDDLISRQAAIDAIPQRIKGLGSESWMITYRRSGYNDCVDACLDALRHLPSVQPATTNEEIRFALKQLGAYFSIKIRDGKEGDVPVELLQRVEEIQKYVDNLPSAEPELKHGKWIKNEGRHGWHCSECMTDNYYAYAWGSETGSEAVLEPVLQDYYCPNCGAKMDEDK